MNDDQVRQVLSLLRGIQADVADLKEARAAQRPRCESQERRVHNIEKAINGNGQPGLITRVTKLEASKATLAASLSALIAAAAVVTQLVF